MQRRLVVAIVLMGLLLFPGYALGDKGLRKAACLELHVRNASDGASGSLIGDGRALDQYKDALFVALKSKLPRLRVGDKDCEGTGMLVLSIIALRATTERERELGYVGHMNLSLYAVVTIFANQEVTTAPIWQDGIVLFGPSGTLQRDLARATDLLATQFAAAYYRAGNP